MKTFLVVAGLLLVLSAAAPVSAKRHHDEQPAQGEDWAKELDQAADGLMSSFVDMIKGMFGSANDDQPEAKTVAELAAQAPANVSILINAVNRADLQKVIADPNLEATIFVPTNQAFRAALVKLKLSLEDLYVDKTALTNILSYHVVGGSAMFAGDLKDGQELTTVSQQKLTVKVDKVAGTAIVGATETAKVVAVDIKAGKAVIHVIDTVLLPPAKPTAEV